MKKLQLSKNIIFTIAALFIFVLYMVLYIQSKEVYSDEWGTDISFNEDYLVVMVMGALMVSYHVFAIIADVRNGGHKANAAVVMYGTVTALGSFYTLGKFFKTWFKALSKGNVFEFASVATYFYIGIFLLIVLAGLVVTYFMNKKEETK